MKDCLKWEFSNFAELINITFFRKKSVISVSEEQLARKRKRDTFRMLVICYLGQRVSYCEIVAQYDELMPRNERRLFLISSSSSSPGWLFLLEKVLFSPLAAKRKKRKEKDLWGGSKKRYS